MRYNDFVNQVRESFPATHDVMQPIATAMHDALETGTGSFTYLNTTYVVTAVWVDHCIGGDCNPATCWTEWTLDTTEVTK